MPDTHTSSAPVAIAAAHPPAHARAQPIALPDTLALAGIQLHASAQVLHLHSQALLTTLSSSFFGGGFRRVRHVLNTYVPADYCGQNPAADLRATAAACGVDAPFVGLMTAVPLHRARLVCLEAHGLQVAVLATAGVGNATSAGLSRPFDAGPGTINVIVLVDARLTRGAMVNALLTVTEAKTAVLQEMDIRTAEGLLATGTSTDTVTLAMTGRGKALPYAGAATALGSLCARATRQAIRASLLDTHG